MRKKKNRLDVKSPNNTKHSFLFSWQGLIIAIIFAIILTYTQGKIRLIFGGIFFIILGVDIIFEHFIYKTFSSIGDLFSGIIFLALGIFSIIMYINVMYALTLFSLFITFSFFLIFSLEKTSPFLSFLWTLLYGYFSVLLISPFVRDAVHLVFLRNIVLSSAIYLFLIFVFIFLSFFVSLKYLLRSISALLKNKNLDNFYLVLSLTLIILILFSGIIITRDIYMEDYPFNVPIEDFGSLESCESQLGNVYFVTGDTIRCSLITNIDNVNGSNTKGSSIAAKRIGEWNWRIYNDNNEEKYKITINEEGPGVIRFRLSENVEQYRVEILHDYPNETFRTRYTSGYITIKSISGLDARKNLSDRILWLIAIFSTALFSVFSAVKSLQGMIDDRAKI